MKAGRSRKGQLFILLALLPILCLFAPAGSTPAEAYSEKTLSENSVCLLSAREASSDLRAGGRAFENAFYASALSLLSSSLHSTGSNQNLLLSPDSILCALAMARAGAGGETRAQLSGLYKGKLSPSAFIKKLFCIAQSHGGEGQSIYERSNAVWLKKDSIRLKRKYLKKLRLLSGTALYEAPFDKSTLADINAWVYNATHGQIERILPSLSASSRLILVNAVRFEGRWAKSLDLGKKRRFTDESGKKSRLRFLSGEAEQVLKLPEGSGFIKYYEDGYAFAAVLPPKGVSLSDYIRELKPEELAGAVRKSETEMVRVDIHLPPFSFDSSLSLKKPLERLGITLPFSADADFSGISSDPLRIDEILHKAHIELDEKGTKAAAATVISMNANALLPEKRISVSLNRPFLFFILNEERLPLFAGLLRSI